MNPFAKPIVKFNQANKSMGRMQGGEQSVSEPIDIDDDISDYGPESVAQ